MNREQFQEHFIDKGKFLLWVDGTICFTENYYNMPCITKDTPSPLRNIEILKL